MNKGLVAVAAGAFTCGFSEFVLMGVLPEVAQGMGVSIPYAGNFISTYAVGVCVGTLVLVLGRRVPPKRLLMWCMATSLVGNALAACAVNPAMLLVARFVSGFPHGVLFGTATVASKMMAEKGKEGRAVGFMVTGQTVANTVGVPGGSLLAGLVSWRAPLAFVAVAGAVALLLMARYVPELDPIPDAGLAGQFRFLKAPGPWIVLLAVVLGDTGLFSWWSYVSPWLQSEGGFPGFAVPALLVLAGLGMIAGAQAGGRTSDVLSPARAAAIGQALMAGSLLLIFFARGPVACAALAFLCAMGMFFVGSPQQVLMVEVGQGGGELLAGACIQVAFNGGNAIGAHVGQMVLNAGVPYHAIGFTGWWFPLVSIGLMVLFSRRFERRYHLAATGRGEHPAA